jgi:hypothetical protein
MNSAGTLLKQTHASTKLYSNLEIALDCLVKKDTIKDFKLNLYFPPNTTNGAIDVSLFFPDPVRTNSRIHASFTVVYKSEVRALKNGTPFFEVASHEDVLEEEFFDFLRESISQRIRGAANEKNAIALIMEVKNEQEYGKGDDEFTIIDVFPASQQQDHELKYDVMINLSYSYYGNNSTTHPLRLEESLLLGLQVKARTEEQLKHKKKHPHAASISFEGKSDNRFKKEVRRIINAAIELRHIRPIITLDISLHGSQKTLKKVVKEAKALEKEILNHGIHR